jgi:hypothetical protein
MFNCTYSFIKYHQNRQYHPYAAGGCSMNLLTTGLWSLVLVSTDSYAEESNEVKPAAAATAGP